jgi:putative tryptophan/tyrosine transport system substrate-binding protein
MFNVKRREFITLLGGAAVWPLAARAQQPKMLRLGFVGIQPRDAPIYRNFLRHMAEFGYQEGRNFTFDYIQTPNVEGYEKNYRALAARKVDMFLAVGNEPALRAAVAAAGGKPIAFLAIDSDPQAKGYVASLSRPGGNVTGLFVRQIELAANYRFRHDHARAAGCGRRGGAQVRSRAAHDRSQGRGGLHRRVCCDE